MDSIVINTEAHVFPRFQLTRGLKTGWERKPRGKDGKIIRVEEKKKVEEGKKGKLDEKEKEEKEGGKTVKEEGPETKEKTKKAEEAASKGAA